MEQILEEPKLQLMNYSKFRPATDLETDRLESIESVLPPKMIHMKPFSPQ